MFPHRLAPSLFRGISALRKIITSAIFLSADIPRNKHDTGFQGRGLVLKIGIKQVHEILKGPLQKQNLSCYPSHLIPACRAFFICFICIASRYHMLSCYVLSSSKFKNLLMYVMFVSK